MTGARLSARRLRSSLLLVHSDSHRCPVRSSVLEGIPRRVGFESGEARAIDVFRIAIHAIDGAPLFDLMIGVRMIIRRARARAFELGHADSDFPETLIVTEFDVIVDHHRQLSIAPLDARAG